MQKVSSEQSSMVVGESIIQISGEEHSRKRDQPAPRPQELLPDGLEAAGGQVWLPRWATLQPGQGAGSGAGAGEFAGGENQALPGPESSVRVMQGASGWGPWSADPSLVPTPKAPHPPWKEPGRRDAALTSRTAHTSRAAVIAVQVIIVQALPLAVVGPLWAQLLRGIPWGREAEMLLVRSPWRVVAAGVRAGPASEGGEKEVTSTERKGLLRSSFRPELWHHRPHFY